MSGPDLGALIEQYRVGLEAQMVLLGQLEAIATRQRDSTLTNDLAALQRGADQRDALISGLMAIDQDVRPIRETLSRERARARHLPGFVHVATLHEAAARIVSDILESDRDSIRALEQIVSARRLAAQAVEHAESTLAAYSRVTAIPPAATLVNRTG